MSKLFLNPGSSIDIPSITSTLSNPLLPLLQQYPQIASLSITNQLLLAEAVGRGWEWTLVDPRHELICLQPPPPAAPILFKRARSELSSVVGVEVANNKFSLYKLARLYSLPTPETRLIDGRDPQGQVLAQEFMRKMANTHPTQYAGIVVKPLDASGGKGVAVGITTTDALTLAIQRAVAETSDGSSVLLQRAIPPPVQDYRLLILGGRLVSATLRRPAFVVGDGIRSVRQLIAGKNAHPWRGKGHTAPLSFIDEAVASEFLGGDPAVLDTRIPAEGETVVLCPVANLSQGGEPEDVTDAVHPDIRAMAERIAAKMRLQLAGVDILASDIALAPAVSKATIIEVNSSPGFRMHTFPTIGVPRNVASMLIELIMQHRRNRVFMRNEIGRKLSLLVCVDTSTSKPTNSIHALLKQLHLHPRCARVCVADRANPANAGFYYECNSTRLEVTPADAGVLPLSGNHADAPVIIPTEVALLDDFDFVMLRLSRPVSRKFLTHLDDALDANRVVNSLSTYHKVDSKEFLLKVPHLCPPMKLCTSLAEVEAFYEEHAQVGVICKPLLSGGGKGITRILPGKRVSILGQGVQDSMTWEQFAQEVNWFEAPTSDLDDSGVTRGVLVVRFLPGAAEAGDKRILVVCGEIVGCTLRMPAKESWLCNISQGGTSIGTEVTPGEVAIANELISVLKAEGVVMFGFDTLQSEDGTRYLSEINPTNVGGFAPAERLSGKPVLRRTSNLLWNHILAKLDEQEEDADTDALDG